MNDPAKLRADRKVAWMSAVEEVLVKRITTARVYAIQMMEHAASRTGDDPLGRDWLERWFFAEIPPEQAAWNVASFYWGWRPYEPYETPEQTEADFQAQVALADGILAEVIAEEGEQPV